MKALSRLTTALSLALCTLCACTTADTPTTDYAPPLMGWSSWNTYHVDISDSLICRQADAMVSLGLRKAGYRYINIDDGFFGYRDSTGRMHAHPTRFARGMRTVADHIHSLGLRAGIYSDAGDNTCGSQYDNDPNGVGAGLYGHEEQDMDLYLREWGFDFIKIDYCGAKELGLDEQARYTAIRQAIDRTGRTDVSVNICRWAFPGTWAAEVARSWRVSSDIRPRWSSVKHCIAKNLYLSAYARHGHYNDMDMLEVGRGLTQAEDETHFGMWCLMSSPLLIGCDLTTIDSLTLSLLTNPELIALNQDPLARQAYVISRQGDEAYILVKDVDTLRGTTRAAALYNATDTAHTFCIALDRLELGGQVSVRDLTRRVDIGTVSDTLRYTVAPHATLICRLQAERRLEPTRYEAEWAYLPTYDDLGQQPRPITYVHDAACSGEMKISQVGGRPENCLEWDEVYSHSGGTYTMTIAYTATQERSMSIDVNDVRHELGQLPPSPEGTTATAGLTITLRPGMNHVRIGNDYHRAPDIDTFTLSAIDAPSVAP